MRLSLIAAVAENGVIGDDGAMPWHLPEDLRRFKAVTTGHPVIMGRRTYDSIVDRLGGPLPDRINIVLSRGTPDVANGTIVVDGVDAAIEAAGRTGADEAFVIGGATVYEQFLPRVDRMLVTEIHAEHDGDTTFPDWDRDSWIETDRDRRNGFSFVAYERDRDRSA